MGKRIRFTS
jgi:hypothetical protein